MRQLFKKNRRLLYWPFLCTLAYTLLGFFCMPPVARYFIERQINSAINGSAHLAGVEFNPFALALSLKGLEIKDNDGQKLLAFGRLYFNFDTRSLLEWAPTFSEVRLEQSIVRVGHTRSGLLNFAGLPKKVDDGQPTTKPQVVWPTLVFDRIILSDGKLIYFDEQSRNSFETETTPLNFEMTDFKSTGSGSSSFRITAKNMESNSLSLVGRISLSPFRLEGDLDLEAFELAPIFNYLVSDFKFKPPSAKIRIRSAYQFNSDKDQADLAMKTSQVEVKDFELRDADGKEALAQIKDLSLELEFSLKQKHLRLSNLKSQSGLLNLTKDTRGVLNVAQLIPQQVPTSHEKAEAPWTFEVENAELADYSLSYFDQLAIPVHKLSADNINVRVAKYSSATGAEFKADVKAKLLQSAPFSSQIYGTVSPLSLACDLKFLRLPIAQLVALSNALPVAKVGSGNASLEGKMHISNAESFNFKYDGNLELVDVSLAEGAAPNEVFGVQSVMLKDVSFNLVDNRLAAAQLLITEPKLHLRLQKDGNINLSQLLGESATNAHPVKEKSTKFTYKIDSLHLQKGKLDFRDDSLHPAFKSSLEQIELLLKGLSDKGEQRMPFNLSALVDRQGRIKYDGQLVVGSSFPLQNGILKMSDFNLTSLSPYALKYLGRPIDTGKLHAEIKSSTHGNTISGDNKITLDRFYFGNQSAGSIVSLPLGTALSIMRDRHGQILLELPVSGDLKSAGLSYRKLLYDALQNLVLEVVSSPISMLASIYNISSEELSHIDFAAESFELDAEARKKIEVLIKALSDKPELRLEITAAASPKLDGDIDEGELNEELFDLANKRADAIKNALLHSDKIHHSRIYTRAPIVAVENTEKKIQVNLALIGD